MSAADVADSVSHWPYLPTLIRLALAVGCGVFVGLEREHHGKAGARTFGLAAFTLMMEALVLLLSAEMPVNAMADLIDEHDTRLWRILRHPSASSKTDRPWQASDDSSGSDKQERMKSSTLSYFFQW
jgi:hypothetical protein